MSSIRILNNVVVWAEEAKVLTVVVKPLSILRPPGFVGWPLHGSRPGLTVEHRVRALYHCDGMKRLHPDGRSWGEKAQLNQGITKNKVRTNDTPSNYR